MSAPQPNIDLTTLVALYPTIDTFAFDVDSTVFNAELLDLFSSFCDCGDEVSEITNQAMNGTISFAQALVDRIEILQLTTNEQLNSTVDAFISHLKESQKVQLTPHLVELLQMLYNDNKNVYFISGGFSIFIHPLFESLLPPLLLDNIQHSHIYANEFTLVSSEEDNSQLSSIPQCISVNSDRFTAQTYGKSKVLESLRGRLNPLNNQLIDKILMIGDGVTDLQAKPPAIGVLGYGGVVSRPEVEKNATWFIYSYRDFINAIDSGRKI